MWHLENVVGIYTLLTCLVHLQVAMAQNWLLEYLLPEGYDAEAAPSGPLMINATMRISTFRIVNEQKNFRTFLKLCLTWHDHRLQSLNVTKDKEEEDEEDTVEEKYTYSSGFEGHYSLVKLTEVERIWSPSFYFRNAHSTEPIYSLGEMRYLVVWPDQHRVRLCTRLRVCFHCLLNLSNFPFDQNHCYFELENFQRIPMQMVNIETPDGNSQVRVMHRFVGTCHQVDPDGLPNSPCVFGAIRFVRHVNYYVIRYYAPTFLIMSIACLGPWVPLDEEARILLSAHLMYHTIRISIDGYEEVPARHVVSFYWWFWGCQTFIYFCILQVTWAVIWVQFVKDKKWARKLNKESPDGYYFGKNGWYARIGRTVESALHWIFGPIPFFDDPFRRNKVDYVGRVVLPSLLLLWVFVYLVATLSPWATKYRYY